MNKLQFPNMQPRPQSQMMSSGYVVLNDIMRYVPPDIPSHMPVDVILGFIPATTYVNGWRYTVLFEGGCGCYLTTAIQDKQFARPTGRSWTDQIICKRHRRTCRSCGVTLCITGIPDGFMLDPNDGSKPFFLCTPHFEEESKLLKRRQFWSGFWNGFFGGEE